jgi:S-adenosylhomocysteine hydrolase
LLKRASYTNAADNGFKVGTYEELIPTADLVVTYTRQTAYCGRNGDYAIDEKTDLF